MVRLDWLVSVSHSVMPFFDRKGTKYFPFHQIFLDDFPRFFEVLKPNCPLYNNKMEKAALGVALGDALDDLLPVMLGVEALLVL